MLYNLLDVTKVSIGEAALYALIGFLVVFAGISFLIFVVWLIGKIFTKADVQKNKKLNVKTVEEIVPISNTEQSEGEITDETVAVIMAALMAYYQQHNAKCEFTVKRIKRI